MKKKILVFGLGYITQNKSDVAVRVVDYLRKKNTSNNLELMDSTSSEKNLSECIESAEQMIVIDTDSSSARRGNVNVYEGFEMDAFIKHRKDNDMHAGILRDAMNLAIAKGKLPRHRALIGIHAISTEQDAGEVSVDNAINRACQKVYEITECWKV